MPLPFLKPRPLNTWSAVSDITFVLFTVYPWKVSLLQVKQNLNNITNLYYNKHFKSVTKFSYELPHKFPNDLSLRILGIRIGKGNLKTGCKHRLVFSFLFKNYFLTMVVKSYEKPDVKAFWTSPILLDFLTFGKIFFTDCRFWRYSEALIVEISVQFENVCVLPKHFNNPIIFSRNTFSYVMHIRGVFRVHSNIYDGVFCESSEQLKAVLTTSTPS